MRTTHAVLVALVALAPGLVGMDVRRAPPPQTPLGPATLLVASPELGDGNFAETVVLLARYGASGAFGLVLNRPLAMPLAELVPEAGAHGIRDVPLHFGGPVLLERVYFLVRAAAEAGAPVAPGVRLVADPAELSELAGRDGVELRAYAGHAGWAPGQLAAEHARGDWLVLPADAQAVFAKQPRAQWRELVDWLLRPSADAGSPREPRDG